MNRRNHLTIDEDRIQPLNTGQIRNGDYVLYWMQASQRAHFNDALEYAIAQANDLGVPMLACFGLTDDYPEAQLRHYAFMLEGLAETAANLADRGVRLVVRQGAPVQVARDLAEPASLVVMDRGYLEHHRQWRRELADSVGCRVVQIESDVVVPVETASEKEEYAARTIRPRIHRHMARFLRPVDAIPLDHDSLAFDLAGMDLSDVDGVLSRLSVDRLVGRSEFFRGGRAEAIRRLDEFIDTKLARYADERSDPSLDIQSHMSPYLHFGQISPVEVALRVRDSGAPHKDREAFLEELIVRRELAINFVTYNPCYALYSHLPDWALRTLEAHKDDLREVVYTAEQLEQAQTHDPYWNAAMMEMRRTGKMHNTMRMYWGKKIIEWTQTPAYAYRVALELNNRWFLDGRDPSSYGNVAWLFGKHDRPWKERPIFGTVRYMNAAGLKRKFDIEAYVRQVEALGSDA